jgi:GT2 family glycosyltransferase
VRSAARRCDLVVALSEAIARDLGVDGVHVVHPGVDLERFTRGPGGPAALFLGALEPWKRPELAIEAADRAGVPLVVAGAAVTSADYEAELRRSAGEGVTFAGRVDDPRALLHHAACLIHCSDREPFGLALVEALACGVPVVAPDAGGPREIVDESCGRLYPPGDAAAAAGAIREVAAGRARLSAAARLRAERHFDLRESRRAWSEAVESVAPRTAPQPGEGIAVVTVLHDSRAEVERLIDSLERHLPGARLVAVDSGSTDDGAQLVRDRGGTVIDLGANLGYGRGTNAGVAAVGEPVVIVANPDVELLDSSLAALAAEARTSGRILAPLVVQPDGRREPSAHPDPGSAADFAAALMGSRPSDADTARQATWATGCCLVARTDVLRGLGPFDERAFLYAEDMDLGLRAADAGIETWFHPEARVLHARAHSTERAFGGEAFELLARRRREVVLERRGELRQRLDDAAQALTFATRIAVKSLARRPTRRERAQLGALRAARRVQQQ